VPVMVIVGVEAGVPASTLIVAVDAMVPPAGGVTLLEENPTWTPLGKDSAVRSTGELKGPIDVTITVSVTDPPELTDRDEELSESEKSAPEVIVSVKVVVCVAPPVPLTVIGLDPVLAPEATFTVKVADVEPPDGIVTGFGLKLEKVTSGGTEPVMESVTGPEYPSTEVPVMVTVAEPPCGIERVPGDAFRLKSGVEIVSLATLLIEDSRIQTFPEASTATSCG
jgi:hypothetical protein